MTTNDKLINTIIDDVNNIVDSKNKVINQLKESNRELLGNLQEEAMFGMFMSETVSELRKENTEYKELFNKFQWENIRLEKENNQLVKDVDYFKQESQIMMQYLDESEEKHDLLFKQNMELQRKIEQIKLLNVLHMSNYTIGYKLRELQAEIEKLNQEHNKITPLTLKMNELNHTVESAIKSLEDSKTNTEIVKRLKVEYYKFLQTYKNLVGEGWRGSKPRVFEIFEEILMENNNA